jgi:hypothetical protein
VRNDERRLALCLFLVIACRARLRAWALFAMLFFLRNLEETKKTKHNSILRQLAQRSRPVAAVSARRMPFAFHEYSRDAHAFGRPRREGEPA